jgi:hypothetical protein
MIRSLSDLTHELCLDLVFVLYLKCYLFSEKGFVNKFLRYLISSCVLVTNLRLIFELRII